MGAGTVEFIAEPDGRFYFMEMNTRLQVEHPVTEMITGHDLVEWQLRVAAGQPLPARQEDLRIEGHAIEARIYAENPEKGFLPSIGTLAYLSLPAHTAFANGDIRVDGGVRMGDTITPFYDPMIAKLIVRGADRDQARARMLQALAQTQAVGVQTNVAFLSRLMRDSAFAAADLDTGLIERQRDTLLPAPRPAGADALALASAAVLARQGLAQPGAAAQASADPWDARDGWRLGGQYRRELQWVDNGETRRVAIARHGKDWTLDAGDGPQPFLWRAQANAGGALPCASRWAAMKAPAPWRCTPTAPTSSPTPARTRWNCTIRWRTRRTRRASTAAADRAHAGQDHLHRRQGRRHRREGPAAAGHGSHEDGAHHLGAGRRQGRRGVLRHRRPGHGRRGAGGDRVVPAARRRAGHVAASPPRRALAGLRDNKCQGWGNSGARRDVAVILWSAVVRHRRSGQHAMPKLPLFRAAAAAAACPARLRPGGAPSYVIFGAYFPRWLLAGLIGIVAALVAHRLFVAKAWNGKLPLQLSVCCAIGMVVAVLFWTLATR